VKYFLDTHIHKVVAAQLRNRGVDVLRCQDIAMENAKDQELLEYAANHDYVIVTNDQGFAGLHTEWLNAGREHNGIFIITHDKDNIGMVVDGLFFWYQC
jgi:predicted nuclease of predicted toxin-antitoxin system